MLPSSVAVPTRGKKNVGAEIDLVGPRAMLRAEPLSRFVRRARGLGKRMQVSSPFYLFRMDFSEKNEHFLKLKGT